MDADLPKYVEGCTQAQGHCAPGKEEVVNQEHFPLLAAYRDDRLSVEAAEQLVHMTEDASIPAHAGEDLPTADRAALLRRAKAAQVTC